jgi:hypothetical protein
MRNKTLPNLTVLGMVIRNRTRSTATPTKTKRRPEILVDCVRTPGLGTKPRILTKIRFFIYMKTSKLGRNVATLYMITHYISLVIRSLIQIQ